MTHTQTRAVPIRGRSRRRRFIASTATVAVAAGTLGWTALAANAAPGAPVEDETTGWSYTKETLDTGAKLTFQIAQDPNTRKAYLTDMQAGTWSQNAETGAVTETATPSAQVVEFDTATRSLVTSYDYTGLSRIDGTGPGNAAPDPFVVNSGSSNYSSLRTDFGTYGIAIDPDTPGGVTLITTTARQRIANAPVLDNDGNPVLNEDGTPATRAQRRRARRLAAVEWRSTDRRRPHLRVRGWQCGPAGPTPDRGEHRDPQGLCQQPGHPAQQRSAAGIHP